MSFHFDSINLCNGLDRGIGNCLRWNWTVFVFPLPVICPRTHPKDSWSFRGFQHWFPGKQFLLLQVGLHSKGFSLILTRRALLGKSFYTQVCWFLYLSVTLILGRVLWLWQWWITWSHWNISDHHDQTERSLQELTGEPPLCGLNGPDTDHVATSPFLTFSPWYRRQLSLFSLCATECSGTGLVLTWSRIHPGVWVCINIYWSGCLGFRQQRWFDWKSCVLKCLAFHWPQY